MYDRVHENIGRAKLLHPDLTKSPGKKHTLVNVNKMKMNVSSLKQINKMFPFTLTFKLIIFFGHRC